MAVTCREAVELAKGRSILDYGSPDRTRRNREEVARIFRSVLQSIGVGVNCQWFESGRLNDIRPSHIDDGRDMPAIWLCLECDRQCPSNVTHCTHCGTQRGCMRCPACKTEGRYSETECSHCRRMHMPILSPQARFDAYPEPIRYTSAVESAPVETKESPTAEESADPDLEACVEIKPKQSPQWDRWIVAIPWAMVVCAFVYFAIVWLTRRECE